MPDTATITIKKVPLPDVWAMRQEIMYPAETLEFVKLEADAAGQHWGLYKEGVLVSVISVFVEGSALQFRKFATVAAQQGKGHGSVLLQYVMDWAAQHPIKSIWCNARTSATGLYQRFGMQPVGETWQKYGLEFIKMEKQLL